MDTPPDPTEPPIDVVCHDEGSLVGFDLQTQTARDWAEENLPESTARLGTIVYVEPRYAQAIIDGMCSDGLTLA